MRWSRRSTTMPWSAMTSTPCLARLLFRPRWLKETAILTTQLGPILTRVTRKSRIDWTVSRTSVKLTKQEPHSSLDSKAMVVLWRSMQQERVFLILKVEPANDLWNNPSAPTLKMARTKVVLSSQDLFLKTSSHPIKMTGPTPGTKTMWVRRLDTLQVVIPRQPMVKCLKGRSPHQTQWLELPRNSK